MQPFLIERYVGLREGSGVESLCHDIYSARPQGRSDGGYIGIYTSKSVTVLFTCGTLTHVLKLQ